MGCARRLLRTLLHAYPEGQFRHSFKKMVLPVSNLCSAQWFPWSWAGVLWMQAVSRMSDLGPKRHADICKVSWIVNCTELDKGFTYLNIFSLEGIVAEFSGTQCKNGANLEPFFSPAKCPQLSSVCTCNYIHFLAAFDRYLFHDCFVSANQNNLHKWIPLFNRVLLRKESPPICFNLAAWLFYSVPS